MSHEPWMRFSFRADSLDVRNVLISARSAWIAAGMAPSHCDFAEQVIAEALNNVVEHAHGDQTDGKVILETRCVRGALDCRIHDDGVAMPDGKLPTGKLAEHGDDLGDLPEGGFGWFLIRTLTKGLRYQRHGFWNLLEFTVPSDPLKT